MSFKKTMILHHSLNQLVHRNWSYVGESKPIDFPRWRPTRLQYHFHKLMHILDVYDTVPVYKFNHKKECVYGDICIKCGRIEPRWVPS